MVNLELLQTDTSLIQDILSAYYVPGTRIQNPNMTSDDCRELLGKS